ncbi:MAG TPA: VOC family protein [Candidatus Elarobacter sp.]
MIRDVAFTAYPCNDVAGTRAWYEQYLGLKFAGPYCEDGIEKYNEAHFGSGCFSLIWSEWVGREPGSAASIVFEVDDIDKMVRSLRAQGIAVEDIHVRPLCRDASLSDPEGNKVTIHQKNPGR